MSTAVHGPQSTFYYPTALQVILSVRLTVTVTATVTVTVTATIESIPIQLTVWYCLSPYHRAVYCIAVHSIVPCLYCSCIVYCIVYVYCISSIPRTRQPRSFLSQCRGRVNVLEILSSMSYLLTSHLHLFTCTHSSPCLHASTCLYASLPVCMLSCYLAVSLVITSTPQQAMMLCPAPMMPWCKPSREIETSLCRKRVNRQYLIDSRHVAKA